MIEIEPIEDWEIRIRFVRIGESWGDVIERLQNDIGQRFDFQNLPRLTEALSHLPIAGQVYASTMMFSLVLSDTADFRGINGVLLIRYRGDWQRFVFHHIAISLEQECKVCTKAEALRTCEQFLRQKFEIRPQAPLAIRPATRHLTASARR